MFGLEFELLLNDLWLLLAAFFAIGKSPFSDNFRFLPATIVAEVFLSDSSSLDESSSLDDFFAGCLTVGWAKPPDTNFTGLKLFGVLVFVGDNSFAGVFAAKFDVLSLLSLSLSLDSDDDDSFFVTFVSLDDLLASTGFLLGFSSESLLSSSEDDDDLPLAVILPFVFGAGTIGFFFVAESSSLSSLESELSFLVTFAAASFQIRKQKIKTLAKF